MTNLQFVSQIINTLKLNNRDEHISKRFVLQTGQNTAATLIAQKWLDRSILSETNLYTYIPCFEFKKVETKDCPSIAFRLCRVLMKSKKKLPKLIFSRLGSSIKEITSINGEYKFIIVDEAQYRRNTKRQQQIKGEVYVYIGADMHLYIPDYEIYSVDLNVITSTPEDADDCSACNDNKCKSKWDAQFIVSDKLLDVVIAQTLQTLGLTKQVRTDENPNNTVGI